MNKDEAIAKMIAPGTPRKGKWGNGIIQIWTTRNCDKACYNCTQGSNLVGTSGYITLEQFEQACLSLKDYFGIVGVFGGNPAMHPQFDKLCEILRDIIPFERRGLWCNNPITEAKAKVMRDTFNPRVSNLNVHEDIKAYTLFKKGWPESIVFGLDSDSRHSPVHVSMEEMIADEEARWELISDCDINKHWSAMIGVFRGELRAWFCEIAGSQAILMQNQPDYPDTGLEVNPEWWKNPIQEYEDQITFHCHKCSVPLRGYGEVANADVETGSSSTSNYYLPIYKPKQGRKVEVVENLEDLKPQALGRMTNYIQNSKDK